MKKPALVRRALSEIRRAPFWRIGIAITTLAIVLAGLALGEADNDVAKPSRSDDQAAIIALDAKYQAAVKQNDAETMGRLLADVFI